MGGNEIVLLVGLELTTRRATNTSERTAVRAEESLEELAALAESAGARVAERQIQTRPRAEMPPPHWWGQAKWRS